MSGLSWRCVALLETRSRKCSSARFFPFLSAVDLSLPARAQTSVTMWQDDFQHTGQNLHETSLTPGTVSSPGNFGLLFTQPTDGQIYGQPLIAAGVNVSGAVHNVVYVATEHDSLYAFDADSNAGDWLHPCGRPRLFRVE